LVEHRGYSLEERCLLGRVRPKSLRSQLEPCWDFSFASRFCSCLTHALWRLERVPYFGFQ
jgi:hypothetical protein